MYPSSSSSSSSQSHNSTVSQSGLTRYGSAPGSLLTTAVDAVIGGSRSLGIGMGMGQGHYFSGDSSSDQNSTCKLLVNNIGGSSNNNNNNNLSSASASASDPKAGLHRSSYDAFGGGSSSLLRQRSSPAGFLSHLANSSASHPHDTITPGGFTITRGSGRLKSQLSFTGGQDSLSQISEVSDDVDASTSATHHHHLHLHGAGAAPAYGSSSSSSTSSAAFAIDPWDNSIAFSASKRHKSIDGDILNCLNALDSQYSLPQTTLEMATMDKLLHIPEDSVPCKIRAKRGCATHPRSIAERERRTRISGKLKKLQDLVPNMDKQTSYADMLDLAVQHIKGLQCQVQKLHNELENCTCGCKPST